MLEPIFAMTPQAVYAARREQLSARLGPRAVALFVAPPETLRNGDSHYRYRQASDLLYLTGFGEPESALVVRPGAEAERTMLFVRARDPEREIWDGRRAGVEGAVRDHGADAAYVYDELATRLPALLAGADELHYSVGLDPRIDALVMGTIARMRLGERRLGRPPTRIVDPRGSVHELRLMKGPEEVATLRRAAALTADAHVAAMRAGRPGAWEYELEAAIEHAFRTGGAAGPGYTTIVGAGGNATVLHYIENSAQVAAGDLVLVDAGAEVDGYTADVTRTFPASGSFTPAQRRAYEVVLRAEEEAIAMTRPGVTLDALHEHAALVLTTGMVELGLLAGPAADRIADGTYRRYYMHRTSHWLGLDVHDVGTYFGSDGAPRPLAAGMVITIEPGLYVAPTDSHAPAELRGLGVRIEDDILVTADGHDVLTIATPKQVADVERACTRS